MSDMRNLELILDGIRDELLRIRKIMERKEQSQSMILQKNVSFNEDDQLELF